MTKLRHIGLIALSSMCLPGVVFVYLSISLIHLNLEEIRSLPSTYLWVIRSFLALWLINAVFMFAALRGRLQWPARLLIAISVSIFVFDMGRGFWLSSWSQVTITALIEVVIVGLILLGTWRVEVRRLLEYAAVFAIILITTTVTIHINAVGPHLVWNVFKEITRPASQEVRIHPNPWRELSSEAFDFRDAINIENILPEHADVKIRIGDVVRIANSYPPGAAVATLPIKLSPSLNNAVVEVRLRLVEGDVTLGLKNPITDQWFYQQHAVEQDGEHQTIYIPIYSGTEEADLVFANGRIGRQSFSFEIEDASIYELANGLGEETAGSVGNVYEILLDAFDLANFLKVTAEQPQLMYDGFTLYEQFRTSQPTTLWSLPTILSGSYYDPAEGIKGDVWRAQAYQNGLFSDLRRAGVSTYQYTWFSQHCFNGSTYCLSSQDYRHELLSQISDNFILDLSFLRILPNSLRAVLIDSVTQDPMPANSWDFGFSLTSKLGLGTAQTSADHILKDFYYSLNLFTIDLFRRMLVEEVQRPGTGQFVFFHAMVPHTPYARNDTCDFIPIAERTAENTEDRMRGQTVCALRLVGWLIEQLKLLGRYDDALIVIHSDHGVFRAPPGMSNVQLQFKTEEWPNWAIESLSSGLLMVKSPGASSSGSSDIPAQTIDIAPTILHHFGVDRPQRYLGKPLQEMSENLRRQIVFYATDKPLVGSSVEYLSKYVKEKDGKWTFEANIPTDP